MNKPLILIVEDDKPIRNLISLTLESQQYRQIAVETGGAAVIASLSQKPDIMILDLGLPDLDGVEIIKKTRAWSQMPIIVVSSRSDDSDKIEALDAGADDYLTKPFSVDELLARIRVALRRVQFMQEHNSLNEEIHLSPIEYKLLCLLAHNVGKVLTHNLILKEVWQNTLPNDTPSLRVYMATLRKKVEPPLGQKLIQTHVGIGYRMMRLSEEQ